MFEFSQSLEQFKDFAPKGRESFHTDYPNKEIIAPDLAAAVEEADKDKPSIIEVAKNAVSHVVEVFSREEHVQQQFTPEWDEKDDAALAFLERREQFAGLRHERKVFHAGKGKPE